MPPTTIAIPVLHGQTKTGIILLTPAAFLSAAWSRADVGWALQLEQTDTTITLVFPGLEMNPLATH